MRFEPYPTSIQSSVQFLLQKLVAKLLFTCKTIIVESIHKRILRDFIMSNHNKVILSLQKTKNQKSWTKPRKSRKLFGKDYGFSNDETEILIVHAVKGNTIKSVIFNILQNCESG